MSKMKQRKQQQQKQQHKETVKSIIFFGFSHKSSAVQ